MRSLVTGFVGRTYHIVVRSLVTGFVGRTYHIVGNTMSRLKIELLIIRNKNLGQRTQITRFDSTPPSKICLDKVIVVVVLFGLLLQKWLNLFSA